jgi:hypothetical protein
MISGQFQAPADLTLCSHCTGSKVGLKVGGEYDSGHKNPGNGNSVPQFYITYLTDKFLCVSVNITLLFMSLPVRHAQ